MSAEWVSVADRLPELGDYSVLLYWEANGGMDIGHVQDYFNPITAGVVDGEQTYARWYQRSGVTHWQPMPEPPNRAAANGAGGQP